MSNTITRLWRGTLDPGRSVGKYNTEMKTLEQLMVRHAQNLEGMLDENARAVFERYMDCVNDYIPVVGEQCFCDGFSLGAKVVGEAWTAAEQIEGD